MPYKITGVIPTPMHQSIPYYSHEPGTMPSARAYPIGEAGRTVSVTTTLKKVADSLVTIFENVFVDVTLEVVK